MTDETIEPTQQHVIETPPKKATDFRLFEFGAVMLKRIHQDTLRRIEQERLSLQRELLELERTKASASTLPTDTLWTDAEVASYVQRSARWVRYSSIPKAKLPGSGERDSVRYIPETVKEWVAAQQTHSKESAVPAKSTRRTNGRV
jgi:hypothetical protein